MTNSSSHRLLNIRRGSQGRLWVIHEGDCLAHMSDWPDEKFHCCVTSPPYWGLRDYGVDGQVGVESTPEEYVERLVEIFREVRRVLRDDGTLWLNLGDSYAGSGKGIGSDHGKASFDDSHIRKTDWKAVGLKPKNLVGIPWRVALALQRDGWYLRQDIIWHKSSSIPEPVKDRFTSAHEFVFLMSKSRNYYFNYEAVREPSVKGGKRTRRDVWSINPSSFRGAHFAVAPTELFRPCVLAGSPPGGRVLDPFVGVATAGLVSLEEGRRFAGIELNPEYADMGRRRLKEHGRMAMRR